MLQCSIGHGPINVPMAVQCTVVDAKEVKFNSDGAVTQCSTAHHSVLQLDCKSAVLLGLSASWRAVLVQGMPKCV